MQGGNQYTVEFPQEPLITNSSFSLWKFSKAEMKEVIRKARDIEWKLLRHGREPRPHMFHPTAITRNAPPLPLSTFLTLHDKPHSKSKRILYHGMGRDTPGLEALSREGRYKVVGYDLYHPDKKVRKFPRGLYFEVWSIYTLNVVPKEEGIDMLREFLAWLAIDTEKGTEFIAIAVRNDL